MDAPIVAVVPVLDRPHLVDALVESFVETTRPGDRIVFVADPDDDREIEAIEEVQAAQPTYPVGLLLWQPDAPRAWDPGTPGTWAEKINYGYRHTTEPWIFCAADDIQFHPGWVEAAMAVASMGGYYLIGTNDLGNPRVRAGQHATHFLVRREYADQYGTVDQPGAVLHEGYRHWCADDEAVQTAIARGCFAPCLTSVVEHHHPLWGKAEPDPTYHYGGLHVERDRRWYQVRLQLIRDEAARVAAN